MASGKKELLILVQRRKTDKMNNDVKLKAWEQLSDEFNSICGEPFRDAKALRGKYENQKKRSKQKFADEKTYLFGTGGGPVKPKILDEIDEKVKDIIGTQMTGFQSEFGGDSNYETMQPKNNQNLDKYDVSISEQPNENNCNEGDNALSCIDTFKSSPSCSTVSDWTKMTPDKLRTPKSKPLKTIFKKTSGKGNKNILSNNVTLWATSKAETACQQREYMQREHELRVELMKERHQHQMDLDSKESEERILIQAKKAELEHEILQLQKEHLIIQFKQI